ncbi:MAG: hypothetical protein ACOYI5_08575 [Christensenellales bacterium]
MKIWMIILLMLWMPGALAATAEPPEEIVIYDLEDVPADEGAHWVRFDAAFRLMIPEGWKQYALSEAQAENNMIACFGDGEYYLFVSREAGAYADMAEYEAALAASGAAEAIFPAQFGGADFLCYSDYESESSNCGALVADAVYTFYFYPASGDEALAQTTIDIMESFALEDTEVADE